VRLHLPGENTRESANESSLARSPVEIALAELRQRLIAGAHVAEERGARSKRSPEFRLTNSGSLRGPLDRLADLRTRSRLEEKKEQGKQQGKEEDRAFLARLLLPRQLASTLEIAAIAAETRKREWRSRQLANYRPIRDREAHETRLESA